MANFRDLALTLALAANEAAFFMATADGGVKNAVLLSIAQSLEKNVEDIVFVNGIDLDAARKAGLSAAKLDRLSLDEERILAMADGVKKVAALKDPVREIIDGCVRPNGLRVSRIRVPLGAILMIFEARPNVTVDAASLCLKSGNACILRGGKEALATNMKLGGIITEALIRAGLPSQAVQIVDTPDRELVPELLSLDKHIDLVVPRGSRDLIEVVVRHSRIPVLKHLDGICHTYVDASADMDKAITVVVNAKTYRPSTCNATETLLVHEAIAGEFLPPCLAALREAGVEVRADGESGVLSLCENAGIKAEKADAEDWRTEYNDMILSVKIVPDLAAAIDHINTYGSRHTDAIITRDLAAAERFKLEVDSSSIMVNASTRFSDGFEYGLGAEIGISTDKLHARGPVGLEGLTTYKWLVEGNGQVRE